MRASFREDGLRCILIETTDLDRMVECEGDPHTVESSVGTTVGQYAGDGSRKTSPYVSPIIIMGKKKDASNKVCVATR